MDLIGKVLRDRYEIEELIGSGGMARVYKAKCRQLNRYVAIKVLREELKDDKEFVDKFKTEALSAASLTHPNIVSVFDSGEDEGIYYFVMEYVEGYTLKQYISRRGALEWREACNITIGICNAIEQAHKNNIVHRDIKPHNIMLNVDGVVKVTDFGIAKAVSSSTIVRGGNIIGSVHYFSPEQARGASSTFKSDIYSIGIVLYELLTGRVPFDANDPFNVAKMQVEQNPIEPKRLNENIPRSVNAVVLRALAKKPEERYNSVTEMIAAIKNAVSIANNYGDDVFEAEKENFDDTTEVPVVIVEESKKENVSKKAKKDKNENSFKNNNFSIIAGVGIGVLIVLAVILGMVFAGSPAKPAVEEIVIDDFIGKDYTLIMSQYEDGEIYSFVIKDGYDEKFGENEIISQKPVAGTRVKGEKPVNITITKNTVKETVMADYIGKDAETVKEWLEDEGFEVEIKEAHSSEVKKGQIIYTIPDKGVEIEKGDKIRLFMSVGPEETDEPEDKNNENTADEGNETNQGNSGNSNDEGETNKPSTGNSGETTGNQDHNKPSGNDKPSNNPYEGL